MKHLKLLIPIVVILMLVAIFGTVNVLKNHTSTPPAEPFSFSAVDFENCTVDVLEHAIYGGESLGKLNAMDTKYFVNILTAIQLGAEVSNYEIADGESANQYLVTLANGEKIYFGQGYGQAEGYENSGFVHINGKVYVIENPAVLNALYVIKERFTFYDRVSCAI